MLKELENNGYAIDEAKEVIEEFYTKKVMQ